MDFEATNNAEDISLDSFFLTGVRSGASLTVGTGFAGTTASAKVTKLGDVIGDGKNDTLVEIDATGNSFSDIQIDNLTIATGVLAHYILEVMEPSGCQVPQELDPKQ